MAAISENNLRQISLDIIKNDINRTPNIKLQVPEKLKNPLPIILIARQSLEKAQPGYHDELVSTSSDEINIYVSPKNVDRAVRFMDTLIKALETRKHTIKINHGSTFVIIDGEEVQISLREKRDRIKVESKYGYGYDTMYTGSGILIFMIGYSFRSKEWRDGAQPLEQQLLKLLANIELRGKEMKEEKILRQKHLEERLRQEGIEREHKQRQDKEIAKFTKLLNDSQRWWKAKVMREYINLREEKLATEFSEDLEQWILWAHRKVDWYDPETNGFDELLDGINKDVLKSSNSPYM